MQALRTDFKQALTDCRCGERLRRGLRLAVIGPPNVGKSSIMNYLANSQVSIVSSTPGATRDVVESLLDLQGFPVTAADTAGLRDSDDPVEQEGVRRAKKIATEADLLLIVADCQALAEAGPALKLVRDYVRTAEIKPLLVANKHDIAQKHSLPTEWIGVSALTGYGMQDLINQLAQQAAFLTAAGRDVAIPSQIRHRDLLYEALTALERAMAEPLWELVAEDLRLILKALGRLTGQYDIENVLDSLFQNFCIGK